ncbi:MAG: hypothetical protein CMM50_07675 [Rhodospirillaceae bacterium]|nr:hypothetical protein [Rhodospirillaceae bacterium]
MRSAARRAVGLGSMLVAGSMLVWTSASAAPAPDSFAPLVKKVTPAVVNISSEHAVSAQEQMQGMPDLPFDIPEGSPFEKFFKQFRDRMPHGGPQGPQGEVHALGSGFVIDPSGYIVTNNHVIDDATNIEVTFDDDKTYPATLVGTDDKTDLALLKIDAPKDLPYVEWGNSDDIQIGDWVLAVGNPFGLGNTVTAGILSARSRDIHAGPYDDFLQIDAAVNRGNSGGPTFATDGKVIGINTAIISPSGGSVGIGFAVPSNLAKDVIAQLKENGHVERGWLGVKIQGVSPEIAEAMGLDEPHGALVAEVVSGSPAEKAGLEQGDVIVGYNGTEIDSVRDLPRLVAATPAGKDADLRIRRGSEVETVSVNIAKMEPEQVAEASGMSGGAQSSPAAAFGAQLAPITPDLRQQFQVPDDVEGVAVVGVEPGSPAAEHGLRVGDVIRQIDREKVSDPSQVETIAEKAKQENHNSLLLLVNRSGDDLFLGMKIGKA